MKILFLIPPALDDRRPAERIFGCNYGIYPQANIFMLYPATILKNNGYEVNFLDFTIKGNKKSSFKKFCETSSFDIVIFYTVFLSKKTDIIARDMMHLYNKSTKFIFISTEPTASPDNFIDENSVVIRGEPEERILPLIEAIRDERGLEHIPGISYRKGAKIIHQAGYTVVEDLDRLPFPDRTILSSKSYYNPKLSLRSFNTVAASRGCSFGCYYCVPNSLDFAREIEFKRENNMSKPPVRLRSPQNVIAEFRVLAEQGYRSICFLDEQFVWGKERTIELCKGIAPFKMEWICSARADMLQDKEITKAMSEAGCKNVSLGIESFNQEILDYIGKGCKVEAFYSAVKNLKEAGIGVEFNILLGSCPLETKETIKDTFKEIIKLDPDYVLFSVCTPFPYTVFHSRAKAEGWMIKPEYEAVDPINESFISYPHLTNKELNKIIRRLYFKYYFRPEYICKTLTKIKSWGDLWNKLLTGLTILR
ncbi:MAG: radical SAM protein [Candidatus Omnitrophica bacterium]|nr:radical SAM protein [Candidatus Omnitrophota bacterium]